MKITAVLLRASFLGALLTMTLVPFSGSAHHHAESLLDPDCMPKYPPAPTVKIMVRVPACAEPGGTIRYCICVENCSTAEAHHVIVKNALPENAKFVKADPPPSPPTPLPKGEGRMGVPC